MKLTNSEKLILLMLSDLYEHLNEKSRCDIDPKFVKEAILSDNTWGFEWQYPVFFESAGTDPIEVNDVQNTLDMWLLIEVCFEKLSVADKTRLLELSPHYGENPKFPGNY